MSAAAQFPTAPVWRRLGAAAYDAVIYAALLAVSVMVSLVLAVPLELDRGAGWQTLLRALALLVGLGYFGWSWIHGGQTLGLRAWRLRMRRHGGGALGWRLAVTRYAWTLAPLVTGLWLASRLHGPAAAAALAAAGLAPYLPCLSDSRNRSLADLLAGTELTLEPRISAVAAQLPDGGQRQ
ncbi:MAG: RDD family protein [Gammaproteobacteria bacterium]|nr:RDD family protein [Gammaproteobacteria bacterium]